ncbi:hypothetical protein LPJ53_004945 [Coemansia erecta]|uniref:Uncharacterized protein n=1 Tax=Coemansia erecta TaxID=147472 RepID=A0A9W7XTD9_9FUNG|nr:hypothetical protein LPJ53_004945 [Coemansia erecta]
MRLANIASAALCVLSFASGTAADSSAAAAQPSLAPAHAPPASNSQLGVSQHTELTQAEARELAANLSMQLIDSLYEMRALSEQKTSNPINRAKDDDDDGGDSDSGDTTTKLINKAASALRPIVKEFANVVSTALPVGPQRQLIKATANAVDSLMPLILKYALGI